MPDPAIAPSSDITVIVDRSCWFEVPESWQDFMQLPVRETLRQAQWIHSGEITILLTDDPFIQQLNKTHRGLDKSTNVLSFPNLHPEEIASLYKAKEREEDIILGDVALAFETIQQEASSQHKSFLNHLVHLVVHGTLHLLGYDHAGEEEALLMESLETRILSFLAIPNPYNESLYLG